MLNKNILYKRHSKKWFNALYYLAVLQLSKVNSF